MDVPSITTFFFLREGYMELKYHVKILQYKEQQFEAKHINCYFLFTIVSPILIALLLKNQENN